MKFTKFGKALLMSAISVGVVLSVSSCVQSYTVGYLYVTGTVTSESNGNGIISAFAIDHNTGRLGPLPGFPIASGGANPVRAILLNGGRFLYVLNRGVNKEGNGDCTTTDPCLGANITQFTVGANGILTAQQTFTTQGFNPFRMIGDTSGNFIMVLEHDSPDNYLPGGTAATANGCAQALSGPLTCGDISVFQVSPTTGRLSPILNNAVTVNTAAAGTQNLKYFPVPANPVDFILGGSDVITMSGTPATAAVSCASGATSCYPYTGGTTYFPYSYNGSNGQMGVILSTPQQLQNITQGTAIVSAGNIYVLDNEPISVDGVVASQSQIAAFSAVNGTLSPILAGQIPDDAHQSNPIFMVLENKSKWFFVANQGNPADQTDPLSGIAGYVINTPFAPAEIAGPPIGFGTGGGPQCLVEDPSNQFFYTANSYDSSVTGQEINNQSGNLTPLSQSSKAPDLYVLTGPPTWCLVDGRTN